MPRHACTMIKQRAQVKRQASHSTPTRRGTESLTRAPAKKADLQKPYRYDVREHRLTVPTTGTAQSRCSAYSVSGVVRPQAGAPEAKLCAAPVSFAQGSTSASFRRHAKPRRPLCCSIAWAAHAPWGTGGTAEMTGHTARRSRARSSRRLQ